MAPGLVDTGDAGKRPVVSTASDNGFIIVICYYCSNDYNSLNPIYSAQVGHLSYI